MSAESEVYRALSPAPAAAGAAKRNGTVGRVEGSTAYVVPDGGESAVPVPVVQVKCAVGDRVTVERVGGQLAVTGNNTSPVTDDERANLAYDRADSAARAATEAWGRADEAATAAGEAKASADTAATAAGEAKGAADRAQASADAADGKAVAAGAAADAAQGKADDAARAAETAQGMADEAAGAARDAQTRADEAKGSADAAAAQAVSATASANAATAGLATVQDVVGTLEWFNAHKARSADASVVAGKAYYEQSESGAVTLVADPQGSPAAQGWWELDATVHEYLGAHLALMDDGLHVVPLGAGYHIVLSSDAMRVYSPEGVCMAEYGEVVRILNGAESSIENTAVEISQEQTSILGPKYGERTGEDGGVGWRVFYNDAVFLEGGKFRVAQKYTGVKDDGTVNEIVTDGVEFTRNGMRFGDTLSNFGLTGEFLDDYDDGSVTAVSLDMGRGVGFFTGEGMHPGISPQGAAVKSNGNVVARIYPNYIKFDVPIRYSGDVEDGAGNVLSGKADAAHTHSAADITSGTLTRPVNTSGSWMWLTDPRVDAKAADNGVSASTYTEFVTRDKAGNTTGAVSHRANADGSSFMQVYARGYKSDGTAVSNALGLEVKKDGTRGFYLTDPAGFRAYIGANSAANLTTGTMPRARLVNTAWAYLAGSATAANYARWREMAGIVFVEVNYASGAAVPTSGSKTFGTIPAGYRPTKAVSVAAYLATNNTGCLWVEAGGAVKGNTKASAAQGAFYGALSYPLG